MDSPEMKTREDLEALKASWLKDPCWDIEETEGYNHFYDELVAFRQEVDRKANEAYLARQDKLNIKTISTDIEGGHNFLQASDLEISELRRNGWEIINVSVLSYIDTYGDFPTLVVKRVVTLTKKP